MRPRLKKILSVTLCVVLAVYVLLAMTSFNKVLLNNIVLPEVYEEII